jgi:hypothetical protein
MNDEAPAEVQQARIERAGTDRPPIERSLTDADLEFMADRAWRHAARSWQEARSYARRTEQHGDAVTVTRMLRAEAESAEVAWRRLANEQKRRWPKHEPRKAPGDG